MATLGGLSTAVGFSSTAAPLDMSGSNSSSTGMNLSDTMVPDPYFVTLTTLRFSLLKSLYLPFTIVGIACNLAALVIWTAQKAFTPTCFLLKFLTVSDLGFLLGELLLYSQRTQFGEKTWRTVPGYTCKIFLNMSIPCTLVLAVFRFIAVFWPLQAPQLLSRGRVHTAGVVIFLWAFLAQLMSILSNCQLFYSKSDPPRYCQDILEITDVMKKHFRQSIVTVLVPICLMLVLNVAIIWRIRQRSVAKGDASQAAVARANRRTAVCVLVVSGTTLLFYPVTYVVRWGLLGNAHATTVARVSAAAKVLEWINSFINIAYYVIFMTQFRRLAATRGRALCRCFFRSKPSGGSETTLGLTSWSERLDAKRKTKSVQISAISYRAKDT